MGVAAVRMPADRFTRHDDPGTRRAAHPLARALWLAGRNGAAAVLVLLGGVLSLPLVPGPGLLLILIGIGVSTMPGKRKIELLIVRRRFVLDPLNRVRAA